MKGLTIIKSGKLTQAPITGRIKGELNTLKSNV
jgi:hypothetical protein